MASIMLVVAFSAVSAQSEGTDPALGSIENPQYIIGTESVPYVITGDDPVTAKLNLNAKAFDGPSFEVVAYKNSTSTMYNDNGPTGTILDSDDDPAAGAEKDDGFECYLSDETGLGKVAFTKDVGTGYFLIEVKLTDDFADTDCPEFNDVVLYYYYAANISIVESTTTVILSNSNDVSSAADIGMTNSIVFQKDTDFPGVYAMVKVVTGSDTVYYGADDYDFYETNLPDGIDMKTDGQIAGKVAASVSLSEDNEFFVYAINKNTGKTVYSSTITPVSGDPLNYKYNVANSANDDFFKYKIENYDSKFYSEVGYAAMENSGSLTITLLDVNDHNITPSKAATEQSGDNPAEPGYTFTAAYSANGSTLTAITVKNIGTDNAPIAGFVLNEVVTDGIVNEVDDYTGIIQLQITKTLTTGESYTATIHVMLVGPLVHSGLDPTVTSA
jgi:hypothetical protein